MMTDTPSAPAGDDLVKRLHCSCGYCLQCESKAEITRLRVELAEAIRQRDIEATAGDKARVAYATQCVLTEQAEAARDRFAAVIEWYDQHPVAPGYPVIAVPDEIHSARSEAIAHHRTKEEEKNSGS